MTKRMLSIRLFPLVAALCLLAGCTGVGRQSTPSAVPSATLTVTHQVAPSATPTTVEPSPSPTPTTVPTAEPSPTTPPADPAFDWDNLDPYRRAMLPAFVDDVERFADATRYVIDLQVDVQTATLEGRAVVRYTNHEQESLDEIVFRLLANTLGYGGSMTVASATVNGAAVDPSLEQEDSVLHVPLAEPLAPGQVVELELVFSGELPTDPSTGYAQYGYFEKVLALPNAYPLIPVYDDEGWNAGFIPSYGDPTFTDTSLYLVRLTLPADMVLATSGVILERRENGDGTTTYLCASGPMREFNLIASSEYKLVSTMVEQVQVNTYYLDGNQAGGQRALDYAAYALRLYQQMFGPYPFTELDVMATPTTAGGIEYPGLIVVAASLYNGSGGFFELATVHETGHQWWYSLVGNDQLDEPWLDEALTQYTSMLYFERRYGPEVGQSVLESNLLMPYHSLQERGIDTPIGLPVEAYADSLYGPLIYGKGPLFFHELRGKVGDPVFEKILSTYYREYRYGVAYPQDFLAVAERVSGQDLDGLYEEWVIGKP